MAAELVLAPQAEEDLAPADGWLEAHRLGLGEDFLARVDACLQSVRRNPLLYPVVHEQYRRALVRRFPCAVFYEPTEQRGVVDAILHPATRCAGASASPEPPSRTALPVPAALCYCATPGRHGRR